MLAEIALSFTKKVMAANTVLVHYTIRQADGSVYYTSLGRKPFQETLGAGKLIYGFEETGQIFAVEARA